MKDNRLNTQYDRRNNRVNSISSSSSSSLITPNASPSWLERKLFSHFKRFFRRKSLSLTSSSSLSSSLSSHRASSSGDDIISLPVDEQVHEEDEIINTLENDKNFNIEPLSASPIEANTSSIKVPVDTLYDYDRLLARCTQRQEQDRSEITRRCHRQISIPHADLAVNQVFTTVLNWKSYVRLFNGLKRDAHLFQNYVEQHFSCQSFINSREQLIFRKRTTKIIFDKVLRRFLDEYVTCLECQTAQTCLIKSVHIWRIECQLCSTQRIVKRLMNRKINNGNHTNDNKFLSLVSQSLTQKGNQFDKQSDK